jgi:hypothetical protein
MNTMKETFLCSIIGLAILFSGCEKLDIPRDYPSTYFILPSDTITKLQNEYLIRNPYLKSSLDEFGFCDISHNNLEIESPPYISDISRSEAEYIARDFLKNNSRETGVNDSEEFTFYSGGSITSTTGTVTWNFKSVNQTIDTIEVLYTCIIFSIRNGFVISCSGNWYPEIYIPERFNFYQSKAKATLNGYTVTHYNIGGDPYYDTITSLDLEESEISIKIIPKNTTDRIELRVCWEIYIPGVSYRIYIDVMNGEIVSQTPTIIS